MEIQSLTRGAITAERMRRRIQRSGFNMCGQPLWTEKELDLLRKHHPDYKAAMRALKRRSYGGIRAKAQQLGLTIKRKSWTAREVSLLRRVYPTASHEEISELLPNRSWTQIKSAAGYHKIYRKRKPFKGTGISVLDQIRERSFELRYSMVDLDALSHSKSYFAKGNWHRGWVNQKAVAKAIKALDGEMKAGWNS